MDSFKDGTGLGNPYTDNPHWNSGMSESSDGPKR